MLTSGVGEASAVVSRRGGSELYRPSRDVVTARRDDRCVLLDLDRTRYWGLDETGTRIWELLVDGLPFDRLVDRLAEEYDADREQLAEDARRFIDVLVASGLVEHA
ncbi:MAG: PqqD family protein [Gemmatimonadetes bacterium]|nr:PqqD family protein [Gemmatimonadota bacterium]